MCVLAFEVSLEFVAMIEKLISFFSSLFCFQYCMSVIEFLFIYLFILFF